MIFSVAALVMVTTMLALTDKNAKTQGEVQRHKDLQAVLKAGIAAAINEINQDEFDGVAGNYDPGNDGVGAITGWNGATDAGTTTPPGVAVTITSTDGTTRTLGFYRTTVTSDGVLTVLAAWPNFSAPVGQIMLASAEMEIEVSTKTVQSGYAPVNPVNFAGTPNNLTIQVGNNTLGVTGEDQGGTSNVPAANVEAAGILSEFTEDFAEEAKTFVGVSSDPDDDGDLTSNEADTITNNPAPAMTVDNLKVAYSYYDTLKNTATALPAFPGNGKLDLMGNPDAVYKVNKLALSGGKQITGEGTLILTGDKLSVIGHGSKIAWKGNVIYIDPGHTELMIDGGGDLTVDGAFLILNADTGSTSEANLQIQGGGKLDVKGIFGTMADHIQVQIQNGARVDANSMNFAFPDPNTFEWQSQTGAFISLEHHSVETTEALEGLEIIPGWTSGTPPTTIKVVSTKAYWEPGANNVLADQVGAFDADGDGPWGFAE